MITDEYLTAGFGRRAAGLVLATLAATTVLGGCGDGASDRATTDPTTGTGRAAMTVVLHDDSMEAPTHVAGGLVDVTLRADDGELPHHVAFFRLVDGVTYDELLAAPEGEDLDMFTFQGGHGTLLPGHTAHLTLDLPPGTYAVRDLGEDNLSSAEVVVDAEQSREEPEDRGTVTLGPGMAIDLPDDFELTGTWRFTDADAEQPHEASLVRLAPGSTVDDLVAWAGTFDGPPPGDFVGGFGAIGPGGSGWLDFDEPLEDGEYVLACFLPGSDGTLHVADGMAVAVPG